MFSLTTPVKVKAENDDDECLPEPERVFVNSDYVLTDDDQDAQDPVKAEPAPRFSVANLCTTAEVPSAAPTFAPSVAPRQPLTDDGKFECNACVHEGTKMRMNAKKSSRTRFVFHSRLEHVGLAGHVQKSAGRKPAKPCKALVNASANASTMPSVKDKACVRKPFTCGHCGHACETRMVLIAHAMAAHS